MQPTNDAGRTLSDNVLERLVEKANLLAKLRIQKRRRGEEVPPLDPNSDEDEIVAFAEEQILKTERMQLEHELRDRRRQS